MPGNHPKESIQHSKHGESCKSWTYNLLHTVNFVTKTQNNSSTATDNIFVDNRINLSSISPIINGISDHDAHIFKIKNLYATITNFL